MIPAVLHPAPYAGIDGATRITVMALTASNLVKQTKAPVAPDDALRVVMETTIGTSKIMDLPPACAVTLPEQGRAQIEFAA